MLVTAGTERDGSSNQLSCGIKNINILGLGVLPWVKHRATAQLPSCWSLLGWNGMAAAISFHVELKI